MKIFPVVSLLALLHQQASAQSAECTGLLSCLDSITGQSLLDLVDPTVVSIDQFCESLLLVYKGQEGIDVMCNLAQTMQGGGRRLVANTADSDGHRALRNPSISAQVKNGETTPYDSHFDRRSLAAPTCQVVFDPAYADESGSGTSYDTLVLTIEALYLFGGKLARSDADAFSGLYIGYITANAAATAAAGVPVVETVAGIALAAVESTVNQIEVHDGLIDSTEIQAAFENTQKLLTQTCNMIGQISTFEGNVNTQFTTVATTLTAFQSAMNVRFTTVDTALTTLTSNVATGFTNTGGAITALQVVVNNRFDTLTTLVNGRLDAIETTLETRFSQLDDLLAIVRTLLITPEGRRTAYNKKGLICDGVEAATGNCPTVPNFP